MSHSSYVLLISKNSCRFVFVLDGILNVTVAPARAAKVLHADEYAYLPADMQHTLSSDSGAGLLLFERRCVVAGEHPPAIRYASPHLETHCCSILST